MSTSVYHQHIFTYTYRQNLTSRRSYEIKIIVGCCTWFQPSRPPRETMETRCLHVPCSSKLCYYTVKNKVTGDGHMGIQVMSKKNVLTSKLVKSMTTVKGACWCDRALYISSVYNIWILLATDDHVMPYFTEKPSRWKRACLCVVLIKLRPNSNSFPFCWPHRLYLLKVINT